MLQAHNNMQSTQPLQEHSQPQTGASMQWATWVGWLGCMCVMRKSLLVARCQLLQRASELDARSAVACWRRYPPPYAALSSVHRRLPGGVMHARCVCVCTVYVQVIELNVSTAAVDPQKTRDITEGDSFDIDYSYSVKWKEVPTKFSDRMDRYSRYSFLPQHLEVG